MTLVSRKRLALIGLEPVEPEARGQAAAEPSQPRQDLGRLGRPGDFEGARPGDGDLDVVPLLETKRLDHGGGEAHGERIAPFGDLHGTLLDIRSEKVYLRPAVEACKSPA